MGREEVEMRDKTVVRVLVTDANNVNQDRNRENAGLDVDFRLLRGSITQRDVQLDSPRGGRVDVASGATGQTGVSLQREVSFL